MARPPSSLRPPSPAELRAGEALARCLWTRGGERRLPAPGALDRAIEALRPGSLERICEFHPFGPVYLLPTTGWVRALARTIRDTGARRVLEVAAGDGFLSSCLARAAPELEIVASDSGAWERPRARMSAAERRALRDVAVPGLRPGPGVLRLGAREAVEQVRPDLVLAAWLPPGPLLGRILRAPARFVLEIGAGGATPAAWYWRWNHEFCEGPVETLARCRLDERPRRELHTRVTLYYGARHPEHRCERVRPGDWLWQFRPARAAGR